MVVRYPLDDTPEVHTGKVRTPVTSCHEIPSQPLQTVPSFTRPKTTGVSGGVCSVDTRSHRPRVDDDQYQTVEDRILKRDKGKVGLN